MVQPYGYLGLKGPSLKQLFARTNHLMVALLTPYLHFILSKKNWKLFFETYKITKNIVQYLSSKQFLHF